MHPDLEKEVLNAILRNIALPSRPDIYVALYDGDPTVAGVEVTGTGYVRQEATFAAPTGSNPSGCANDIAIEFIVPVGENWGDVDHFAVLDDESAGDILYSDELLELRNMTQGTRLSWDIGELVITQR